MTIIHKARGGHKHKRKVWRSENKTNFINLEACFPACKRSIKKKRKTSLHRGKEKKLRYKEKHSRLILYSNLNRPPKYEEKYNVKCLSLL